MMKQLTFLTLMVAAGILLSACQPEAVETPTPEDKFAYGQEATVESLDVILLESFPLQVQAVVSGYFPDGCVELHEITVERDGTDFVLTLTTRRPTGDIACTEALVPFEETVNLEIEGLEAGTYRVIAQDQETAIALDVNTLYDGDEDQEYVYGSGATVEGMTIHIMESFPVQVSVTLTGYLPDGCTEIEAITSSRQGQTFEIEIETRRPASDVACTMALVPFEEVVSLDVNGLSAGEYTVRSGESRETFSLGQDNALP